MEIRHQQLLRYILPLREGGSLPALAEADDGFRYVVKFRGAGHGSKALIAELIGTMVAKALGFSVPEGVFLDLDPVFGITEGDEEIQDLLRASEGLNFGLHFLEGSVTFDANVNSVDPLTASMIVWLDAFLTNVDRTSLNTNMLLWHNELWLIDHGASLYFHHSWRNPAEAALDPFPYIRTHALLGQATRLQDADRLLRQKITPRTLEKIVALLPDSWLTEEGSALTPDDRRRVYTDFLVTRLKNSQIFVKEADEQRKRLV